MILIKKSDDLRNYLKSHTNKLTTIGFVPTMGALHEGHLSLIKESKKENTLTVCSIFVNPTQFNEAEDYEKYPITLEQDIYRLDSIHCDILLVPSIEEVYPEGINKNTVYNIGHLESVFEGKYRPGHFQGVCMVVHRLLDIVQPHRLYVGQKDFQQCKVISLLLELIHKEEEIELKICPTMREKDGLAMSSRNMRLSVEERVKAVQIFAALEHIKKNISPGNQEALKEKASKMLQEADFAVDYLEIADEKTLEHVHIWDGKQKIVALIAARLGNVRLIDNMLVN